LIYYRPVTVQCHLQVVLWSLLCNSILVILNIYFIVADVFIRLPFILKVMARFRSSTFGKISGKHGNAVTAVKKDGTNILKILRVASNPNTPAQKNQRDKFAFTMRELNCFRSLYNVTYQSQYGANKAVGVTINTALTGEFPDFRLDYSKLILTNGSLFNTSQVSINKISGTTVSVKWNTEILSNSSPDDHVNPVYFNQLSKSVIFKQQSALRKAGNVDVELLVIWETIEIHAWIYLTSPDETHFSASQYIGLLKL